MKKLYTIGYEGAQLDDFLATLQHHKTHVLLDIREIPISRRKGFSKTALKNALAKAGIDYRHEKLLGSPKKIRHRLREDGNYKRFFRDFDRHLDQQGDLLETLIEELRKHRVALMCYEKDFRTCHRSSVVDALAEMLDVNPIHLEVEEHARRKARKASYPHLSKSLSPA